MSDLQDKNLYPFWTAERVRFADLDALGHVNNNAFGIYFESGRIAFMIATGLRLDPSDPAVVVAHLEIDFRAELHYPGDLEIGVGIITIGNASVTLGAGLFKGDVCHATSKTVMVHIDRATHKSKPMTEAERALLAPWMMRQ